jgi:hypothetical protein
VLRYYPSDVLREEPKTAGTNFKQSLQLYWHHTPKTIFDTIQWPKCRWVNNIKMDLRDIGWCGMEWIDLAPNRDQQRDSCEHCNETLGSIKCWEVLE